MYLKVCVCLNICLHTHTHILFFSFIFDTFAHAKCMYKSILTQEAQHAGARKQTMSCIINML